MARDRSGNLFLYRGNGKGGWLPRTQIGSGWNIFRDIIAPGDFNGDGTVDIVARDTSNNVWFYPGNGRGGWFARKLIGKGWSDFNLMIAPGKFWGSNRNTVMARDFWGDLRLYIGNEAGGFNSGAPNISVAHVGTGWDIFTRIGASGDFNGDSKVDVYGIDRTGAMWMYFGNGDPSTNVWYKGRALVGTGWNQFTAVF